MGPVGFFAFQFGNPKAWMLVLTAAAAAQCRGCSAFRGSVALLALLTVIPAICLTGWALLGRALIRHLTGPTRQAWFERSIGLLLLATAVSLIVPLR